ncbi:crotonase/enoyl-CoA hydratase family protein [Pararhodobacter marinus]|uniref:Enoyl-CoA hydratase n=2 Tax=Pararhodobacter marinus TaxID=2184063 RepID=A0A2U2CHW0_9RHOB|nr:crotonase/enoyl-CoA hydratase family protein [Pararhodobacter marinus]PWE31470.1 enoyl-CoA hydratase [Pararhodobacter marinus]
MQPFLDLRREGALLILTMQRPEERNAISTVEYCREFEAACAEAEADKGIAAVILTGAGSAFSAGGNLKKMLDRSGFAPRATPIETRYGYREAIQRIPLALWNLEVPTIAAVNGPAIGAGLDLACMCDIRIAAESARFAESFVRVGIIPGDGGAYFLPRIVGASKAYELCFTGEAIDAAEAKAIGLVSKVVPDAALMDEARALAHRIAVNPPHALRLAKRLLRESEHAQLSSILELSAAFQALMHETEDHREAVTAFLEKRPAVFTGR